MAQTITLTKLYELLKETMPKEQAENLTQYIEEKVSVEVDNRKVAIVSEIKLEIEKLRTEMEKMRTELHIALRNQLWAIIALFIPMYTALAIFFFNYFKD